MRQRFVPSYYARDMLNKVQCLQQGSKSVEEYFQELQIGMLHFGLVENDDAAMTRVFGVETIKFRMFLIIKNTTILLDCFTSLAKLNVKCRNVKQGSKQYFLQVAQALGSLAQHSQQPPI
jgi:hypothetical protein